MSDASDASEEGEPDPTPEEVRIIAWCAEEDVGNEVDGDDPDSAIAEWLDVSRSASPDLDLDPLANAVRRIGHSAAARVYEAARESARALARCVAENILAVSRSRTGSA